MCEMTHSDVWHDSFICDMTHSYVTHDSLHSWHDSYICDMTHSYVTWLIHIRYDSFVHKLPHSYVTWLIHMWHDPITRDMSGDSHICNESCVTYEWVCGWSIIYYIYNIQSHTWLITYEYNMYIICNEASMLYTWLMNVCWGIHRLSTVHIISIIYAWHMNESMDDSLYFIYMTHSYVIHMNTIIIILMTYSYVIHMNHIIYYIHDSFICHPYESYKRHDVFICHIWLVHMWHNPITRVYKLSEAAHVVTITWRGSVTHDAFTRDMTQSHVTWLIQIWHESFTRDITVTNCRRQRT